MEKSPSRRRRVRHANFLQMLEVAGGPLALARALGKDAGLAKHYSSIKADRRGVGDDLARDIEAHFQLSEGWMDQQHLVAGEPAPPWPGAQNLSHTAVSDDLPLLSWEQVMATENVPAIFRTVLRDDALAPDYPRGAEIVWTTRRRAIPGRMVLVVDAHGQLHARQCRQGREPGRWLAAAINPSYLSFDSSELRLIAVLKGVLEPDDD